MSFPFWPTTFPLDVLMERTSVLPFLAKETTILPVLTRYSSLEVLTVSFPAGEPPDTDALRVYSVETFSDPGIEWPVHLMLLSGQRAFSHD